jgi:hypothetical protein
MSIGIGHQVNSVGFSPASLLFAKHSPPDEHNYRPDISWQEANRIWRAREQFLRMPD